MEEIKEIRTRNELADYIGVPRKKNCHIYYMLKNRKFVRIF